MVSDDVPARRPDRDPVAGHRFDPPVRRHDPAGV